MNINIFEGYVINWIPNIKNSKKPIYITIAEELEKDIKNENLAPGTRLPSQRDLANYLNVNLGTIAKAFKICREKGLIHGSVGKGTFTSSDTETKKIMFSSSKLLKGIELEMGSLVPNTELSKETMLKLQNLLETMNVSSIFKFDSPTGSLFQRKSMIKLSKKLKLTNTENNILFSSGSQNAITAILMSFFKKGDKIGTTKLIYPGIKAVANMLGIQLIPIKENNNEITEENLMYLCKTENIKGLYLIPDYNVPTTHTLSNSSRKTIAEIAIKEKLLIIEDSLFSLMSPKVNIPIANYAPENTFYIFSPSKIIANGLRFAFISVPTRYKENLLNTLYNINISTTPLIIDIVSEMINSKLIDIILKEKVTLTIERNKIINEFLEAYNILGDLNCPFRWLILPENVKGKDFEKTAYEKGLKVYCSERYIIGNEKTINAIRISILSIKNNNDFKEAVKLLKKLLKNL